ncbi:retinol dehydrogenase 13-like [Drosophila kikkawai]|uniref:NADP-retinol dehydrogenase n=1 Tax=Drosophila kikkawai TaxID=30033 RepID=A0A6P4IUK1_DROKI|nr:retinol dehydrogenase 13-like [Drosophila kikkawai]
MCAIIGCLLSPVIILPAILGTVIYYVRKHKQGIQFKKHTDEPGKVFIVTGSNTGIGKEIVRELAKRGGTVYIACRDLKRCEQARLEIVRESNNPNVFSRELDLNSLDSIHKFVAGFKREQDKLHVLINNAGIMRCPRRLTKDGFESQLGVNHMGHFLLTNLLLDVLKKSAPSRIVVLSSVAHTKGNINFSDLNSEESYDEIAAYSQSKLANVLFARELAKRLEGSGVTVNALNPGSVNTELARDWNSPKGYFIRYVLKPLMWPILKTPKSGAQNSIYLSLDPDLVKVSGRYFHNCQEEEPASAAQDDATARRLWVESEKWTGLDTSKLD